MFVLRRITSENNESNTSLGDSYHLIDAQRNPEQHKKAIETLRVSEAEGIYGFIAYKSGQKLLPLYKKSTYFVMTENGATFANVSFK